jgi:hypothetical protein
MATPSAYQQMTKTRSDIRFKSALYKHLRKFRKARQVRVGIFPDAVYPDGTPVAQAAFFAEYGTVTEPPRPFMRQTMEWEGDSLGRLLFKKLAAADGDMAQALKDTGETLASRMKVMLASGDFEPLSPVTLMLRRLVDEGLLTRETIGAADVGYAAMLVERGEQGATGERARPLLDTMQMYHSITSKVDIISGNAK